MTPATIRDRLLAFLRAHRVLTLAVADATGRPHAAALFYAIDDDLCFYVLSDPTTGHGRVLAANGLLAGTVQSDRQQWQRVQGVQFHARGQRLTGEDRCRAWRLYTRRFPFLRLGQVVLRRELARMELWRLEPDWLRLIDNRRGFGHKEEWRRC